jgi:hypothetical protein
VKPIRMTAGYDRDGNINEMTVIVDNPSPDELRTLFVMLMATSNNAPNHRSGLADTQRFATNGFEAWHRDSALDDQG